MQLQSLKFNNTEQIPDLYTCKGQNINPPLNFINVPKNAKSLALIIHDPDSPSGNFIHWAIWNIPANTDILKEGSVPKNATEGLNDFGKLGYGGPCPHQGIHRYVFSLFALDNFINLPVGSTAAKLEHEMQNHLLQKSELIGLFSA